MNYKTAYKKLNQNGVIDEIINREVVNGESLNMVKYAVSKELAKIEIAECATYTRQLQYMIDVQKEV